MNNEPSAQEQLESLNQFYSNPETREKLDKIASNLITDNILITTAMYERNHSNMLKWILGDNNHGCGYKILEAFLREITSHEDNKNKPDLTKLKKYIKKEKEKLKIEAECDINRNKNSDDEKGKLDLFFCDDKNKTTITIENKPFYGSKENKGQLKKYNDSIKKQYSYADNFFIFLTYDGKKPTEDNWLIATYQMLANAIISQLPKEKTSDNTEKDPKNWLVLYIDLLKRKFMINDEELDSNCLDILKSNNVLKPLSILYKHKEIKEGKSTEISQHNNTTNDLEKLCDHIWREYEIVLDVINEYRGNLLEIVYDDIIYKLKNNKHDFYDIEVEEWKEEYGKNRLCPGNYNKIKNKKIELQLNLWKNPNYIWFGYYQKGKETQTKLSQDTKFKEFYEKLFTEPYSDNYGTHCEKFIMEKGHETEREKFISKIKTTLREFKEAIDELTS